MQVLYQICELVLNTEVDEVCIEDTEPAGVKNRDKARAFLLIPVFSE